MGTILLNFFLTSPLTQPWFAAAGSPGVGGITELPNVAAPQPVASAEGADHDLKRYLAGAGVAFLLLVFAGGGFWAARRRLS